MNCKICKSTTQPFGEAKVMGKYAASYRRCTRCAFIFVADPTWIEEAYQSPINKADIGPVNRMVVTSRATKLIIDLVFRKTQQCLDYGSGYGLFVRRMRDLGYDFKAYDRYCKNLFAADFQVPRLNGQKFDISTAFEVMEHAESPMETFDEIFAHADILLFTTDLVPIPTPALGQWWYYALEHGQHISFFTAQALEYVASAFGKKLSTTGAGLHLISHKRIKTRFMRLFVDETVGKLWELVRSRPSLLMTDFDRLRKQHIAEVGAQSI